jgi:hypothetical protein
MSRLRTWFLNLFIVFITGIIAAHLVWTYSPVKNNIKQKIISELRPYLGESFLLHDFTLGFGYISFHEVTTTNLRHTYNLNLKEVRIGYDMLKLLLYEFKPLKVIETVTLKDPQLIVYQSPRADTKVHSDSLSSNQVINNVLMNFQKIPNIDRIFVNGAKIIWELDDGQQLPLLDELNGYMVNTSNSEVDFDLVGKFYGSSNSVISLSGKFDLFREKVNSWLIMDDCPVSSDFPFLKNGVYTFDNAILNGEVHISSRSFLVDSLILVGNINAKDFSAHIFNQHAVAENIDMELTGQSINFKKFHGTAEDGNFEFEGVIENLFDPQVHWYLDVDNYSARFLNNSHSIFEHVLDGKLKAHAEFHGPLKKIQVSATASADEIQFAVVPFSNVEAELTYSNHLLKFSHVRADFRKFRTVGSGKVDFDKNYIGFALKSDLKIPPETFDIVDKLNESEFKLNTDFRGDIRKKQFYGNFDYSFTNGSEVLFEGDGPYTLDDQFLYFTLNSLDLPDTVLVAGAVDKLFSDPTFKILSVRNFPVKECTSSPVIAETADDFRVNLFFEGPYDFLKGRMSVLSKLQNDRTVFTLAGNLQEVFSDTQNFKGQFTAQTAPIKLSGEMGISFGENGLTAEINSPGLVKGNLFFGFNEGAPVDGRLFISRFSVSDYLANNPGLSEILSQGFLDGEVDISGTVQKPNLQFNLSANEFIINDVGYYSTQVIGEMKNHILSFEDFWVRLNNNPVFSANFLWDVDKDTLDIEIAGENIESNFLAETIFKDKNIIRGYFSYAIKAEGPAKRPKISGNVEVRDGTLKENSFKAIHVDFEDSISTNAALSDLNEHVIKIDKLVYIDRKDYTVSASGFIGIGKDSPLDITANVTGNILSELPNILSYFEEAKSVGELDVHFEGTTSNPKIVEAKLSVFDGSIKFASVIPQIKDLQVEIELSQDDNYVQINKVQGNLDGQWARIYNVREAPVDSAKLSPWYFEELGLNFGVLVLETSDRGIPLAIPGLMEDGDIGYFATAGRNQNEKFYFAGPVDQPYARGTVILSNCRVTFPFIGMDEESEETNPVVEFLMNTEWDVKAVSREDNRYFVDIPAYVGEANMDLNIDNVSPGLIFTGRMIDESFRVEGSVQSSRGRVEYLDVNFKVERFGADFTKFELYPTVYGRAYNTVRDSTGEFSRDIYLVLYAIDPETKQEISRGRWEDFRFKLVSSDPVVGETQEQVLAYLGYSVQNIPGKASEVGLTMTENFLIRPIMRPIEKRIEKELGLDYVRLRSRLTSNLFYLSMQNQLGFLNQPVYLTPNLNNNVNPALLLLQSSEITVGKYLARDLYLTYTGQLLSGYDETNIEETKLGFYHRFGLEYRLLKDLLLEVEYNNFHLNAYYYDRADLNDFRVRLRQSFHF